MKTRAPLRNRDIKKFSVVAPETLLLSRAFSTGRVLTCRCSVAIDKLFEWHFTRVLDSHRGSPVQISGWDMSVLGLLV